MKTAIVGAGPAGAALARLLKSQGEPFEIYDKPVNEVCGLKPCAWGMRAVKYEEFCRRLGLNPRDYCLRHYDIISIQGIRFKRGLAMLDKPKLLKGLMSGIRIIPEELANFDGFDRVIDATGAGEIGGNHNFHLTYQIRAKGDVPEPSVYVDPEDNRSLLWLFPLGDGTVHVGIMSLLGHRQPDITQVGKILEHYRLGIGSVLCDCKSRIWAGGIREPTVSGRVWRIGESGGFVDPVTGSGMAPAFASALSAFENWHDPDAYTEEVRRRFAYCDRGVRFLGAVIGGGIPSCVDILNYLSNSSLRGISLTPSGIVLLALRSREFDRVALSFGSALLGNHREVRRRVARGNR